MLGKKGGMISAIVVFVIVIAIGASLYLVFGKGVLREGHEKINKTQHEVFAEAKREFKTYKLSQLHEVEGMDKCNNARGYSIRNGTGRSCSDAALNNYSKSSLVKDCCCCNVTQHVFDFGTQYAYKDMRFYITPQTNSDTFNVSVYHSAYPSSNFIKTCEKELNMSDQVPFKNGPGLIFDCYLGQNKTLNESQFRYVKINTSDGFINYAKAEISSELRLCRIENHDLLMPGKGYWVYSTGLTNVTIPGTDYMAPVAFIEAYPHSTLTNNTVYFNGSKSFSPKPNCGIDEYNWALGDGNTSTNETLNHKYMEAGNYTVILRVTDCDNNSSRTRTIITVLDQYPHAKFDMYYKGFYSEDLY